LRVAIATVQVPFVRGGAEMHAEGLRDALRSAGHEAEIASMPFKWYPPELIPTQILAARLLDLEASCGVGIDRLVGLKFPAYLVRHPAKVLWLLHQHRSAYDLWESPYGDLHGAPHGAEVRDIIRNADARLIPEARAVYTNSRNVTDRLRRFCGIDSTPLYHPPPQAERYALGGYEDFFLMPSRVNAPKRQDLVLEALLRTRNPVRICFIGAADSLGYAEALRAKTARSLPDGRALWLGGVPDREKVELLGRCLAVVFPPFDEDYGYVTLEAMLSSKAVVTCSDSGGPLEFVLDGETGVVCPPDPDALARALDALWEDRALARRMGEAARARYDAMPIGWDRVLECLLG
jgi:glycosyltransferase involved in cell wall biosynthesis